MNRCPPISPNVANLLTRRQLFGRASAGIGTAALASLLGGTSLGGTQPVPRAKRVIYLFMHGGPSSLDLFDHKPSLKKLHGQELPASVRGGQRLTGMTSGQKSLPIAASIFNFQQHGKSGAWMSELLVHAVEPASKSSHTTAKPRTLFIAAR